MNHDPQPTAALTEALDSGALATVRKLVSGMHAADIALLIESLPPKERQLFWHLLETQQAAEVLSFLGDEVRNDLLAAMDAKELSRSLAELDTDDLADVLQQLPERIINHVLDHMRWQDRQRVEPVLQYSEDTAGGLMNTDTVTVRTDIEIEVVLRYLRRIGTLPPITDHLIVIGRDHDFLGLLSLQQLLVLPPHTLVQEAMETDVQIFSVDEPSDNVASTFERHDLISAPVVDAHNKLIGRITIDDVVDQIRSKSDARLMNLARLSHAEDTFGSFGRVMRERTRWLGINLITAFMAAFVIGWFEDTIETMVALAVLMPIVTSMGGIAGTQALTVMVRALALNQINHSNFPWLFKREIWVGLCNGLLWAVTVSLIAGWWFHDGRIAWLIAVALIINLVVAAISGVLLPLLLTKCRVDPALAGGVLLTTITDIVGFLSFLGFAAWYLG